jgi:hypothetical protein
MGQRSVNQARFQLLGLIYLPWKSLNCLAEGVNTMKAPGVRTIGTRNGLGAIKGVCIGSSAILS